MSSQRRTHPGWLQGEVVGVGLVGSETAVLVGTSVWVARLAIVWLASVCARAEGAASTKSRRKPGVDGTIRAQRPKYFKYSIFNAY